MFVKILITAGATIRTSRESCSTSPLRQASALQKARNSAVPPAPLREWRATPPNCWHSLGNC
jgi:hypothetical protein